MRCTWLTGAGAATGKQWWPHCLQNTDHLLKRLNSLVLPGCIMVFLLHQYHSSFRGVKPILPIVKSTYDTLKHITGITKILKKTNFNRCRHGASGRIFTMSGKLQYSDWAALSDATNFTACFFYTGLCWKEEKAWGKAGSAQREWLRCGNLSIFEA